MPSAARTLLCLSLAVLVAACSSGLTEAERKDHAAAFNRIADATRGAAEGAKAIDGAMKALDFKRSLSFSSRHRPEETAYQGRTMDCVPVPGEMPSATGFCAESREGVVHWWLVEERREPLPMGEEPLGTGVGPFEIDKYGEHIAIVTGEEGHPMLGVYNFTDWLKHRKKPDPFYYLNPYPGELELLGWENNSAFSGLDLTEDGLTFSTDGPVPGYTEKQGPMQTYRLLMHDKPDIRMVSPPAP